MKPISKLTFFFFLLGLLSSCQSMYQTSTIDIEIVIPGKAYFPKNYDKLAVRYNNANIRYSPESSKYYTGKTEFIDKKNTDSIASLVYYDAFISTLQDQILFDSIVEIESGKHENINWIENPDYGTEQRKDSVSNENYAGYVGVAVLQKYLCIKNNKQEDLLEKRYVDPHLGLYTEQELQKIRKISNADVLLSLDIYESTDGKKLDGDNKPVQEIVYVLGFWNFYDLQTAELKYFYDRVDTISWEKSPVDFLGVKKIPPRKHAVLNAAEVAGSQFAEHLVPHWIAVERMYYKSGQNDMKRAQKLMKENRWLEAAEIWKKQSKSKNKFTASKSMYNLAVANEMEGNIDAAIDWVVKSYHKLGNKHIPHPENCLNYIDLLALRKQDLNFIEYQLNGKTEEHNSE